MPSGISELLEDSILCVSWFPLWKGLSVLIILSWFCQFLDLSFQPIGLWMKKKKPHCSWWRQVRISSWRACSLTSGFSHWKRSGIVSKGKALSIVYVVKERSKDWPCVVQVELSKYYTYFPKCLSLSCQYFGGSPHD